MQLKLFILSVIMCITVGCRESRHPLISKIDLPIEKYTKRSDYSRSLAILVYRNDSKNNAFARICDVVRETYSEGFLEGSLIDVERAPRMEQIERKYTENLTSVFEVKSRDMLSNVIVLENSDYVTIYLVDGR